MSDIAIRLHAFVSMLVTDLKKERGQDLIEYAMLGGLIAVGILLVAGVLTGFINDMVTGIGNCIDFNNSSTCTPGW
jgi:Flp pilus assembly pilin Flp